MGCGENNKQLAGELGHSFNTPFLLFQIEDNSDMSVIGHVISILGINN